MVRVVGVARQVLEESGQVAPGLASQVLSQAVVDVGEVVEDEELGVNAIPNELGPSHRSAVAFQVVLHYLDGCFAKQASSFVHLIGERHHFRQRESDAAVAGRH